jgi:ABC-type sugar transport system ATPase subunit
MAFKSRVATMNMIEFRAVSKQHRGRPVIDNLSFTLEAGERVVLFGHSGCGKSTVLYLIAGLIVPEAGDILMNGRLVSKAGTSLCEPEQRGIGMVFQELALWPHMTVEENIQFGLKARRIPVEERNRRAKEWANRVGIEERLEAKPPELSGGEQQRVALARALVLAPSVVLMDEPLSSLDELLKARMLEAILNAHRQLKFTMVYVTHDRDEAKHLGARIIRLG